MTCFSVSVILLSVHPGHLLLLPIVWYSCLYLLSYILATFSVFTSSLYMLSSPFSSSSSVLFQLSSIYLPCSLAR
jgi:hypothetical protein